MQRGFSRGVGTLPVAMKPKALEVGRSRSADIAVVSAEQAPPMRADLELRDLPAGPTQLTRTSMPLVHRKVFGVGSQKTPWKNTFKPKYEAIALSGIVSWKVAIGPGANVMRVTPLGSSTCRRMPSPGTIGVKSGARANCVYARNGKGLGELTWMVVGIGVPLGMVQGIPKPSMSVPKEPPHGKRPDCSHTS